MDGGTEASCRPSSTRIGPDRRRTDRPDAEEAEHRHHRRPTKRVTRGSRLPRAPRVVLRTRARTELASRRSFFVGRQLLDRPSPVRRARAAVVLRAMRRREPDPRSSPRRHRSRTARAAAPRAAVADGPAVHTDDPGEAISLSRLPDRDDRRSSRRHRAPALHSRRDRPSAVRLQQAGSRRKRVLRARRPLGPRARRMAHRSPMALRRRRWARVSRHPLITERVAASSTGRAGRDDACGVRRLAGDRLRGGSRVRGSGGLHVSRPPLAHPTVRSPPRWADSLLRAA